MKKPPPKKPARPKQSRSSVAAASTVRTPAEHGVIARAQSSIRWVMESGYSRTYAEDLALRAYRAWPGY